MRFHIIYLCLIGFTTTLNLSCAKKRQEEKLLKENTFPKTMFDPNEEYLYIPTTSEVARYSDEAIPFFMGDQRIVTFRIDEKDIVASAVDQDEQFGEKSINEKPILRFPITHVDYRCKENEFGECTKKEMEEDRKTWQEKRFFKPKFEELEILETQFMPLEPALVNRFGTCFEAKDLEVIDFKTYDHMITIVVDRTYQADIACEDFDEIDELSFKVRFNYSFAKLSAIASPDYEPVSYPEKQDEGTFGFFSTKQLRVSTDGRWTVDSKKQLLNRFNPNRKTIPYYLSPEFSKPEWAAIKKSTIEGVDAINRGFKAANIDLQIELIENEPVNYDDFTKNYIILVEDPVRARLLGYGPSVTNPRTGEIIGARTVMFGGVLKSVVQRAYDEILMNARQLQKERSTAVNNYSTIVNQFFDMRYLADPINFYDSIGNALRNKDQIVADEQSPDPSTSPTDTGVTDQTGGSGSVSGVAEGETWSMPQAEFDYGSSLTDRLSQLEIMRSPSWLSEKQNAMNPDEIAIFSRHNMYPAAAIDGGKLSQKILDLIFDKDNPENMKEWQDLEEATQAQIIEILLPKIWLPTFIHEMGHNLGLRHNFAGSEDQVNFAKDEAGKVRYPYSSVMEYPGRELDNLTELGPYDLAALRFAYNREVEVRTQDGSMTWVKIKNTLQETLKDLGKAKQQLKDYSFCTDEHVTVNPNCNRFDAGTGFNEMSTFIGQEYERNYSKSNQRLDRLRFNLFDDLGYAYRIKATFQSLRLFFERYDDLRKRFFSDNDKQVEEFITTAPWVGDLRKGMLQSFDALMKTLTYPSTHLVCMSKKSIIFVFNAYDSENYACKNSSEYQEEVATVGKSFRNRKMSDSVNNYIDEIDVRGVWMDKLVALDTLLSSHLGYSFDRDYTSTYLDVNQDIKQRIEKTLMSFLLNQVKGETTLRDSRGMESKTTITYHPDTTHRIPPHLSTALSQTLGIDLSYAQSFNEVMIDRIHNLAQKWENRVVAREFLDKFSTLNQDQAIEIQMQGKEIRIYTIGSITIYAGPQNEAALLLMNAIDTLKYVKSDSFKSGTGDTIYKLLLNGDQSKIEDALKSLPAVDQSILKQVKTGMQLEMLVNHIDVKVLEQNLLLLNRRNPVF